MSENTQNRFLGTGLYIAGVLGMLTAIAIGNSLQSELRIHNIENYLLQSDSLGALLFYIFVFGYPLGMGISVIGAIIIGGTESKSIIGISIAVILATLIPGYIPIAFGRSLDSSYFGIGGYMITVLFLATVWYWGKFRSKLPASKRVAADLQGIGYLFFAVAIWNICGVATLPAFTLEPEVMLRMNTQGFAIGQMKSIMALFIAGWVFTLAGFWKSMLD